MDWARRGTAGSFSVMFKGQAAGLCTAAPISLGQFKLQTGRRRFSRGRDDVFSGPLICGDYSGKNKNMSSKTLKTEKGEIKEVTTITAPNFERREFTIIGTAPYMQARFAQKAMTQMREKMEMGSKAKKGKDRPPRDFDADYEGAKHKSAEGWCGIPAGAFRAACISACRLVGFKMTLAKLALFVEADGLDVVDGTPLVRIIGEPERVEMTVRNSDGSCDLRVRPVWREWSAKLRVRYDGDIFSLNDVANLLNRVGSQVGIGEGRPDSKKSAGLGFGTFELETGA
jgi:hypothetical protein